MRPSQKFGKKSSFRKPSLSNKRRLRDQVISSLNLVKRPRLPKPAKKQL